eukprot:CAMPEP_0206137728 /NCGR_PEP_ID=MMETSP1473-20131121/2799_1 /ASSEMBLY_ACC=CAM_ASM_001109 /TAXON_ID=1461547 /ORGANISM="Stichococcus sp, Strain RCC1054" /LENGTH=221 /DNA_ID=CAMNT_0053530943 /DNA_START=120 /DNA_END=785 /DNA_ORIENTATION=-
MASLMDMKQIMRQEVKQALRKLDKEVMKSESAAISAKVLQSELMKKKKMIGIYIHAERLREVDTTSILQQFVPPADPAQRCYVPIVVDNNANMRLLHLDSMDGVQAVPPFGIREPSLTYANGQPREDVLEAAEPLEVLVMPGLAFDHTGSRLGRGGGYYDAFISRCRQRAETLNRPPPVLVALAFQAQLVDSVPMSDHDQKVDVLVTSEDVYRLTDRGACF